MLEHLVVHPRGGLCNRLRAIASAKRLCAKVGARCTILWDWGDYHALFADDTQWIPYAASMSWEEDRLIPGYHHIRHLRLNEGGSQENRRVPVTSHPRIALTTWHVFGAVEEPVLYGRERDVRAWFPDPNTSVLEKVRAFRQARFADAMAGLHMRRTDHKRAIRNSPDEAYWQEADRLVSAGYTLFLGTDNDETLGTMQARYGDRLLHYPKTSPLAIRWPRPNSEPGDVIDDLVDLWLLVSCDFVIGSSASSYSRVAILLNGSPRCRAIDLSQPRWRPFLAKVNRYRPLRRPATVQGPRHATVFGLRPGAVEKALVRWKIGEVTLRPAVEGLLARAREVMLMTPASVMEKPTAPASGDRHDYVSYAPYYWPDPTQRDGRPYVRRDGHINPECYGTQSDRLRLINMAEATEHLAWAFILTRDESYARHAAGLLRAWFIDPATRMNPNLRYAQIIPGHLEGRHHGILDGHYLLPALDAASLLVGARCWSETDDRSLVTWASEFLDWLRSSENGKREAAARNNHGSLYDVQVVHLALFVGDLRLARRTAERARRRRVAAQIRADGSQPFELQRPESFHYSQYNLRALFQLAVRAEHAGVDLWQYRTRRGAGIRQALDFLVPYLEDPAKTWPHPGRQRALDFDSVLRQASRVYADERYTRLASNSRDVPVRWTDLIA